MVRYIEPFAGSGAVFLRLFGASPPCGFAGNKRRAATALARLLWPHTSPPDRVVLADVGPWREVWETFAAGEGQAIIGAIRAWPDMPDRELWDWCLRWCPGDQPELAAQYLYLQARQAHHAPIWQARTWIRTGGSGGIAIASQRPNERWQVASGSCGTLSTPGQSHANGWRTATGCLSGNPLSRATLIRRLESLMPLPWHRLTVLADYRDVLTLAGPASVVYADPPYLHARVTYAGGHPPDLEEQLIQTSARGATVAVSEGRLLPALVEAGWWHADVTQLFGSARKPASEWLMMSSAPGLTIPMLTGGIQQELFDVNLPR